MYVNVCVYVCIYMYIICVFVHTGLEIGSTTLPNANHFGGNCESLWQSDSPNFLALRITFG